MSSVSSNRRQRRTRRKQRRLLLLTVVLCLVLLGLLAAIMLLQKNNDNGNGNDPGTVGNTEPAPELTLPQGITILTPVVPANVGLSAEDFVSGLDGTGITVSFGEEPALEAGEQTVSLVFTDGKAICSLQTSCTRFAMVSTVTVDVTENRVSDVWDFVEDKSLEVSLAENIALDSVGEQTVTLLYGGKSYQLKYIVKESNPPTATASAVTAEIGTVPNAADLVTDIMDESKVTVTYKTDPVLTTVGDYPVTLVLTDAYGNTAEVSSVIHVIAAANAPQFTGLEDLRITLGESISYKKGVEATDAQDGSVSFTVDASAYNRAKEGTYVIYYSATDSDGNTTIAPRKIIVKNLNQSTVENMVQGILDKIITADMSRDQKIQAVYAYSKQHIQYVGSSNKENIWRSAYEGLVTGKGDCYTYYAVNRIMLDMLGIENLEVRRIGGTSNHWWNLVLFEDGIYYHVDSCPASVKVASVNHAKMTDADLVVYTNDPGVINRRPNFYVYDKTLPEYQDIQIAQ